MSKFTQVYQEYELPCETRNIFGQQFDPSGLQNVRYNMNEIS